MQEWGIDWYKFGAGLVLDVDARASTVQEQLSYVSPPDVLAEDDPAILFKGAVRQGAFVYACTPTEVLVYRLPEFRLVRYLSLPAFNDLHHVRADADGHLLIASTGLDLILKVDHDDRIVDAWSTVDGQDPWSVVNTSTDFRRIASTKPHRSHPNHIFLLDGEPWATRFEQRDAISLTDPGRRIEIGLERVHDGVVVGDWIYFTTVDGKIVIASGTTLTVEQVVDLGGIEHPDGDRHLGWCRGLHVDGCHVWVGFSRLRLSRVRANLAWVRWGFKPFAPTRIACYDLEKPRLESEIDLQQHGLDAIFSILPGD